ncbi:hypothetical protein CEXT_415331 [Caerostris extrusa]|uniref:Uncharacterized protein n=1 Tax=Caerostris extrusa TaxID=172846 RepID=A0AAV4WC46_CAEEX|nr:hypothetical protein CEXT_415331 [Caerostris extrusa]
MKIGFTVDAGAYSCVLGNLEWVSFGWLQAIGASGHHKPAGILGATAAGNMYERSHWLKQQHYLDYVCVLIVERLKNITAQNILLPDVIQEHSAMQTF